MKQTISLFRFTVLTTMIGLSAAIFFTACNKDKNDENNNSSAAGVMAFNLAPDGRSVGFLFSDRSIFSTPLVFNSYTGAYLGVSPGSQTVGAVNFTGGGVLASSTYNFEANKFYSVFLVGNDPAYEEVIVRDNIENLATTTQAFIRYINAIPDASSPTVTISVNGVNVINETAAFKTVSGFTDINPVPGPVTITVSNGGTINATRTITLDPKKIYTILLVGKPGGTAGTEVQIKFITNGTVGGTGRMSSSSLGTFN